MTVQCHCSPVVDVVEVGLQFNTACADDEAFKFSHQPILNFVTVEFESELSHVIMLIPDEGLNNFT